ncbi:hypothetical protein ST47_g9519 [Ascochyta rabiei]|uniref:Uncharacterized protein n=1 Tax=Didymella rabiei TaxID=5454 RepID=A0A162X105_DIDRA|nr:hypothetical protein ST47_g9519 [Ascochyta rabiei]
MKNIRSFSFTAKNLVQWLGLDRKKLPDPWISAIDKFGSPGGGAEKMMGAPLESIEIMDREGNAVHQSHFDPTNEEWVVSVEVKGPHGTKRCHVFSDGKGTMKKGGKMF